VEEVRLARPDDHCAGAVRLDELAHAAERPGSDDTESRRRPVLEAGALGERVVVGDVDDLGAGAISRLGDRDNQLAVRAASLHEQHVALRDSERRLRDRVGVAPELARLEEWVRHLDG